MDDLFLVAENEQVLKNFKEDLENHFDLKYFGQVSEYLGIEFERTNEGYEMSQHKFLKELVNDFLNKGGIRPRRTPIKVNYEGYGSSNNPKEDAFYELLGDTSRVLAGR